MNKFIKLNEKKQPLHKFDEFYTEIKNLDNAAILLNNEIVLIDFDGDNNNEEKIINYFKNKYNTLIQKTTRGYHFFYKKPKNLKIKNVSDQITMGRISS